MVNLKAPSFCGTQWLLEQSWGRMNNVMKMNSREDEEGTGSQQS